MSDFQVDFLSAQCLKQANSWNNLDDEFKVYDDNKYFKMMLKKSKLTFFSIGSVFVLPCIE